MLKGLAAKSAGLNRKLGALPDVQVKNINSTTEERPGHGGQATPGCSQGVRITSQCSVFQRSTQGKFTKERIFFEHKSVEH